MPEKVVRGRALIQQDWITTRVYIFASDIWGLKLLMIKYELEWAKRNKEVGWLDGSILCVR